MDTSSDKNVNYFKELTFYPTMYPYSTKKLYSSTIIPIILQSCCILPRDVIHKRGLCRHAVSVCPCVRVSVTFVSCVKTNKDIFEIFSPSGSQAILVFSMPNGMAIFRREPPNRGAECKGGMKNSRFSTNISL